MIKEKRIMRLFKATILISTLGVLLALEPTNRTGEHQQEAMYKTMFPASGVVEHVIWDGNQISTIYGNHGTISDYHVTGNSGTEWPKGSGKTAIFQSGVWLLSGKSRPQGTNTWTEEIRSAAGEYTCEFVPGTIDEVTNDGHIYQIHKKEIDAFLENDWATFSSMSGTIPLTEIDGADVVTVWHELDFPTDDFKNWPVDAGAPWVDANDDGIYEPENGDYPEILGDMFHWHVMNDGDAGTHTSLWGTAPMNVEVQTSVFGFDQAGALGNIMFFRWVIINKGQDDLDSVFVSIWHDDDVGDHTDDLVGCVPELGVGYTYNDADGDTKYGTEVPAVGSDFFQGPLVDSETDTATILTWAQGEGYYVKTIPGKKRLGMTSFTKYINGNPIYADPNTAEQAYNYMNGLVGTSGDPYLDHNGEATVFVHSGDPTTGTGWIDEEPADRRYLMTSGPFTFNVGDTVEVVGSIIIAAGSNWAKSITKMLYFDNFAQGAFDANFDICSPAPPQVEVSQLDKKVILSFEEKSDVVEEYECAGYSFQGYNIYQGASVVGPWTRVTTYDVVDGVKLILDNALDEDTGELLESPAQFGTDSGIDHYIEITDDMIGNTTLINYRQYYFAVTAYAYDGGADPRVIESPINAYIAIPRPPGVGTELAITSSDDIDVTHTGLAGATLHPTVVDPYLLTGQDYSYETTSLVHGSYAIDSLSFDAGSFIATLAGLTGATSDQFDIMNVSGDSSITLDVVVVGGAIPNDVIVSSLLGSSETLTAILEATVTMDSSDGYWELYEGAELKLSGTDFPVTADHYTVLTEANNGIPPAGYYITNTLTDGFIFNLQNATWFLDAPESHGLTADSDTTTSFVFSAAGTGGQNTMGGWLKYLHDAYGLPAPSGAAGFPDLQKDLRYIFSEEGSVATYFKNSILSDPSTQDTFITVPLQIWDIEGDDSTRLGIVAYQLAGSLPSPEDGLYSVTGYDDDSVAVSFEFNANIAYIPIYEEYDATKYNAADALFGYHPQDDAAKFGWMISASSSAGEFEFGNEYEFTFDNPIVQGSDTYSFTATGKSTTESTEDQIELINIFPNPYFGQNPEETIPQNRKVYFTHLGIGTTTIRIFTISGDLVQTIEHEIMSENSRDDSRAIWDLRNDNGIPVASGVYFAHITVQDANGNDVGEKVLKLAIFQPEERLDVF
jgi:hypothetical protein